MRRLVEAGLDRLNVIAWLAMAAVVAILFAQNEASVRRIDRERAERIAEAEESSLQNCRGINRALDVQHETWAIIVSATAGEERTPEEQRRRDRLIAAIFKEIKDARIDCASLPIVQIVE